MVRALPALLLLFVGACKEDRTEIVVLVGSDLDVPDELDELHAEVTDPDGEVHESDAPLGPDEPPLPRTLGILWTGGPLEPVHVRIVARLDGIDVIERTARTGFIKHQTLLLTMDLLEECEPLDCGLGSTCVEGSCRPDVVAPETLPRYRRAALQTGDAGRRDGSPQDAGGDDSAAPDAPPAPDACVMEDETCNFRDDDCDRIVDEDFDLMTDPDNCGMCGRTCSLPDATAMCADARCVIDECGVGFADCDADPANGCEVDTDNDTDHCGMCDRSCSPPDSDCCDGSCGRC